MPCQATPGLQADSCEIQLDVIVHHQQLFRFDIEEMEGFGDALTAEIHQRHGLEDRHGTSTPSDTGPFTMEFVLP